VSTRDQRRGPDGGLPKRSVELLLSVFVTAIIVTVVGLPVRLIAVGALIVGLYLLYRLVVALETIAAGR
jgi:hypothetical protein